MTLKFALDENDYLQHQLYLASISNNIKSQRKRSLITVVLAFLVLAFLFFQTEKKWWMYYFVALSILSVIFYPFYLQRYYKRHYRKHISDTYKNRFNEPCTIIFNEASIEDIDKSGETKMDMSAIEEIVETGSYVYLRIKTGGSLIIPKSKIEDPDNLLTYLRALSGTLKIKYSQELNWKWK